MLYYFLLIIVAIVEHGCFIELSSLTNIYMIFYVADEVLLPEVSSVNEQHAETEIPDSPSSDNVVHYASSQSKEKSASHTRHVAWIHGKM